MTVPPLDDPWLAGLLRRCAFPPPGTDVVLAVSGGADSAALTVLASAAGLSGEVVHVDHGLRPGSASEADRVADLASRFGHRFRAERVDVADGPDLEARCRLARHAAVGPGALFGHTLDDQAETVLWHLLRGAGLDGLGAMGPDRHPLLGLRRHETVEVCEAMAIEVVVDPTNESDRFTRNRIRREVLPLLSDVADRDVAPALARFAALARTDASALERLADRLDVTDAKALGAADRAVAARAVRRWLRSIDPGGHPPDAAAVERVLDVAAGDAVATEVGGGWRVERHRQRLGLVRVGDGGGARG